jgi:hypothetical protein
MFDHVPDSIPVDSEVVVDKDIPHPDDVRLRDVRVCGPELRGDSPHRFPDDLEVVDDPDLRHLVIVGKALGPAPTPVQSARWLREYPVPVRGRLS